MTIVTGQYFNLNGLLKDADGKLIDKPVSFASSDNTVVKLKLLPSGVWQAHGLQAGSVTITATYGMITSTLSVDVVDQLTPASIEISVGTVENSPN
jgi:hypothetical protein